MTYDELEILLNKMVVEIQNNLAATGTNASGKTSASLRVVMTIDGGQIRGRKFFRGVETGRAGGRVPRRFTDIIAKWIVDKGIQPKQIPYKRKPSARWQPKYSVQQRSLLMLAGAIAYKIKKSGTSLYRAGGRKDIYTNVYNANKDNLIFAAKKIITDNLFGNGRE